MMDERKEPAMVDTLQLAAQTYVDRRTRRRHPAGRFDTAGRWYPNGAEQTSECAAIRPPSRAYPYSLMLHCRTAAHVAALYGVERAALLRVARLLDGSQKT
jgi:hypothetical protein